MATLSSSTLTETLVLALSQCQEQLKIIQEYASRVDQLQQDNERLTEELEVSRSNRTARSTREDLEQTQDLFQKHVEAQAEIKILKKKLRSYKEKANQKLPVPLSSPGSTPATPAPSSPKQAPAKRRISEVLQQSPLTSQGYHIEEPNQEHSSFERNSEATSSSPPWKRARVDARQVVEALKEVPNNPVQPVSSFTSGSRSGVTEQRWTAISELAEDGDEDVSVKQGSGDKQPMRSRDDAMYHRLDGLLAGSTLCRNPLSRPVSRSPRRPRPSPRSHVRDMPNISNIKHTIAKYDLVPGSEPLDHDVTTALVETMPKVGSVSSQGKIGPEEENPSSVLGQSAKVARNTQSLRTRSITDLMLSSFKPNPRWLSSHNISFDDFVNDRQYERVRILAATLPHLPGETHNHHFTDHELLMEFLGPGSEARIANLTIVARQNLIMEARTKRVANEFKLSKQTAAIGNDDDPPGFWSTDMPGTQEAEENKMASRRREREEVQRRYGDAVSGQGRWIFADE